MDAASVRNSLIDEIHQLCDFITEFEWLIEAHGARYFTREYGKLIPQDWLESLLQLSETTLYLLPSLFDDVFKGTSINPPKSLITFLKKCKSFSLPIFAHENALSLLQLPPVAHPDPLIPSLSTSPLRQVLTKGMAPKKRHEVEILADLIYRVSVAHGCRSVLDLGCGQGYLMQILSFYYKLDVLGVDSSALQTNGAVKRAQQTQLLIQSLFRKRPEIDRTPIDLTPVFLTLICPIDTNITISQLTHLATQTIPPVPDAPKPQYPKRFQPIPFREPAIHPLLSENGVILVGLHTCGDLAPTTLRLFHESPTVKAMINVGCCYNLMTETGFPPNGGKPTNERNDANVASSSSNSDHCQSNGCNTNTYIGGYPLSSLCKDRMPRMTRTARVLACQSVAKRPAHVNQSQSDSSVASSSENASSSDLSDPKSIEDQDDEISLPIHLVHRSQLFRAVLQVIYEQYYSNQTNNYSGQYSREYLATFATYATHLIKRQNFEQKMTSEEMEQLYQKIGEPNYHKLVVFDNIRVCLSPVIEALIMKDRLLFLKEQDAQTGVSCQHALFPIFNATVSPRNMAFLSTKQRTDQN
jgi:SAM-dependent methyltransferase